MADLPKNPTTELRVLITEDSQGNLDVEYQCIAKGTEVVIPVRPSHVIGQLVAAAIVVAAERYAGIRGKFQQASSKKGNSKSEGKHGSR